MGHVAAGVEDADDDVRASPGDLPGGQRLDVDLLCPGDAIDRLACVVQAPKILQFDQIGAAAALETVVGRELAGFDKLHVVAAGYHAHGLEQGITLRHRDHVEAGRPKPLVDSKVHLGQHGFRLGRRDAGRELHREFVGHDEPFVAFAVLQRGQRVERRRAARRRGDFQRILGIGNLDHAVAAGCVDPRAMRLLLQDGCGVLLGKAVDIPVGHRLEADLLAGGLVGVEEFLLVGGPVLHLPSPLLEIEPAAPQPQDAAILVSALPVAGREDARVGDDAADRPTAVHGRDAASGTSRGSPLRGLWPR
jgi:hypothetical protein